MPAKTTIASRRKQVDEPYTHIAAAKACLKKKRRLSDFEVNFCERMTGWMRPTAKQIVVLRFCCRKVGISDAFTAVFCTAVSRRRWRDDA